MSAVRVMLDETRQSWRGLLRRPGYLALAVFTLALGLATTTLVFALIDQAVLQPLPFADADRLVTLGQQRGDEHGLRQTNMGAPGFLPKARRMSTLADSGMTMGFTRDVDIGGDRVPQVMQALYADRGFLRTLGVSPMLGRNFSADEDTPNGPQAAILSHALWQRQFGGSSEVTGSSLLVDGRAVRIVGVMPSNFAWPDAFDVMLPMQPDPASVDNGTNQYLVARLKPGATLAQASAEFDAAVRPLYVSFVRNEKNRQQLAAMRFNALPLAVSVFSSQSGPMLWLFLAASLCVLAIATVNLGNLMLLRSLTRDHALAVRAALGAPVTRLALPALAESLLIAVLGALGGLVIAALGLDLLDAWIPSEWLRGQPPSIGWQAGLFALLAAVLVALAGSMLAVWRGRRQDVLGALRGSGRGGLERSAGRMARALIIVQVAVAAVLLLGASLFARSLQQLSQVPMGFESRDIVTFTLMPVKSRHGDIAAVAAQARSLGDALRREPGIVDAQASAVLPTGSQLNLMMQLPDGRRDAVQFHPITSGFLDLFGIHLQAGRGFDISGDGAGGEKVCIVSAAFARTYLDSQPLGKIVNVQGMDERLIPMRVVGVAGDVHQFGPADPAPPVLYLPLAQLDDGLWQLISGFMPLRYAVQVKPGMEATLTRRLPEIVQQASPGQPINAIQTMQTVVASTTSGQRLNLLLVGVFSALALLLAAVGLYAVMATAVAARRHEFGVRAALGAPPTRLLGQVLGEGAMQLALGLGIGLLVALALSRLAQRFLFGIGVADPLAIGMVVVVLAAAGVIACLLPALRAARVHPMQALRVE